MHPLLDLYIYIVPKNYKLHKRAVQGWTYSLTEEGALGTCLKLRRHNSNDRITSLNWIGDWAPPWCLIVGRPLQVMEIRGERCMELTNERLWVTCMHTPTGNTGETLQLWRKWAQGLWTLNNCSGHPGMSSELLCRLDGQTQAWLLTVMMRSRAPTHVHIADT